MTRKYFIGGLYIECLQSSNGIFIASTMFDILKDLRVYIVSQFLQFIETFCWEGRDKIFESTNPVQPVLFNGARARKGVQLSRLQEFIQSSKLL